jgi:hypothetical protein
MTKTIYSVTVKYDGGTDWHGEFADRDEAVTAFHEIIGSWTDSNGPDPGSSVDVVLQRVTRDDDTGMCDRYTTIGTYTQSTPVRQAADW